MALRRRDRLDAAHGPAAPEDCEHAPAGPRGRGSEDRARPVAVVGVADGLRLGPLAARRVEPLDPVRGEDAVGRQVGDVLEVHLDPPDRPRQPATGRHARLGGVPEPLGPDRRLVVAEIDRAHDRAALPPAIGWLVGPEERVAAGAGDPEPGAPDRDPRRRQLDRRSAPPRHSSAQENESLSSSATSFETSR